MSNLSDCRFKTQVKPNIPGLDFIMKLRPVTFNWDLHALDAFQKSEKDDINKEDILENAKLEKEKRYIPVLSPRRWKRQQQNAAMISVASSGLLRPNPLIIFPMRSL